MNYDTVWLGIVESALRGLCANPNESTATTPCTTARCAAKIADTIIDELKQRNILVIKPDGS
jgi:uncharacterized lipoprotein NlpE involved in copper resistance